jgi:ubiquinone/menaquinone biosynthesis C-methylase UbiE
MPKDPQGWKKFYQQHPDTKRQFVHEDAEGLHQLFKVAQVERLLDLGCGDGRHLKYFSKFGFQVFGIDISPTALQLAKDWLLEDNLFAELTCGDMTVLPWPDNFFDALVSDRVLNHGYHEEIELAIAETYRVLQPGGWFFLCIQTGAPPDPDQDPTIKILAPNTYAMISGMEEIGVPHYCFSEDGLLKAFSKFNLETGPYLDKRGKTCLLLRKPGK